MPDSDMDALVEFVGVQKSYDGEILVVKDLHLKVARGEFLTMLGPSGSGKTTCLLMLAGFEAATHGEITLSVAPIRRSTTGPLTFFAITVTVHLIPIAVRRLRLWPALGANAFTSRVG